MAGFYDFGPPGCAIKGNFTQLWRQHFVLEESMLEVEQPQLLFLHGCSNKWRRVLPQLRMQELQYMHACCSCSCFIWQQGMLPDASATEI